MPKGTNQKLKLYRLALIMTELTDDEHMITMPEIQKELAKYEITADRKTFSKRLRMNMRPVKRLSSIMM